MCLDAPCSERRVCMRRCASCCSIPVCHESSSPTRAVAYSPDSHLRRASTPLHSRGVLLRGRMHVEELHTYQPARTQSRRESGQHRTASCPENCTRTPARSRVHHALSLSLACHGRRLRVCASDNKAAANHFGRGLLTPAGDDGHRFIVG